jgi:hypothetical protein
VASQIVSLPEPHRWLRLSEWILLALLAVQMGTRAMPKAWRTLNTDFPNYYLTANLIHEHYDTSRVYEWLWFQRQKDHRGIDQRIVTMVPITPFSTLVVYPFASLPALAAKHCWLIANIGLLFATIWLVQLLTQLPWQSIALVAGLSFPLRVNFLLGQYYVFLLFLLTLACWLYIHQKRFLAGAMVGLGAALKIFPVVYLLYFLRKRDIRAFVGGVVGILSAGAVSIFVFGWELHRVYLFQVLPSVLRGEGLDPYNLQAASLSSLLHRLFIYEPQLNQHPAVNAPWLFAVLHPLLQMALMAPVLLLVASRKSSPRRVRMEWAAILIACLAMSTSAASYLFVLLILPVCLLWGVLRSEKTNHWPLAILLPLYVAAGFLGGSNTGGERWMALLAVPRLYVLIVLCVFAYALLVREQAHEDASRDLFPWSIALLAVLTFGIASNLRHQNGLYGDYPNRISLPRNVLMAVHPAARGNAVLFVALLSDGYHSAVARLNTVQFSSPSRDDQLAVAARNGQQWIEQVGTESIIMSNSEQGSDIRNSESPVLSPDGQQLAFLREERGRARIWVQVLGQSNEISRPLTSPEFNVLEMTYLPAGGLIFSAVTTGQPALFKVNQIGDVQSLNLRGTRYPSVSPDGQWLAYSELQRGNWNLWLLNLGSGQRQRLTHAACNNTEPTWTSDSQTLIYASDCGRALWFSALCRLRINH